MVNRILPRSLAFLLLLLALGCSKKPAPPPPPLPPAEPPVLVEADNRFDAGDWTTAADLYDAFVDAHPDAEPSTIEKIHFRLGLIHSNPGSSLWDPDQAQKLLCPLADAVDSAYQAQAATLVTLLQELSKIQGDYASTQSELRRVSEELQKIKEIDRSRRDRQP